MLANYGNYFDNEQAGKNSIRANKLWKWKSKQLRPTRKMNAYRTLESLESMSASSRQLSVSSTRRTDRYKAPTFFNHLNRFFKASVTIALSIITANDILFLKYISKRGFPLIHAKYNKLNRSSSAKTFLMRSEHLNVFMQKKTAKQQILTMWRYIFI